MLTYAFIIAFLLLGFMWLRDVVLRQEKARSAHRRRWHLRMLDELTEESADDDPLAV